MYIDAQRERQAQPPLQLRISVSICTVVGALASVFVLLYFFKRVRGRDKRIAPVAAPHQRQCLYFCRRVSVRICTFVRALASVFVLFFSNFCRRISVSTCTFVLVKLVNFTEGFTSAWTASRISLFFLFFSISLFFLFY